MRGSHPRHSSRRLRVTVYTDRLKFIGLAYVGIPARTTSRRPSDILFHYSEDYIKLADVRIIDRHQDRIIDEPPFVIVNMRQITAIYAMDEEEGVR